MTVKENVTTVITLGRDSVSTIVAALRLFQRNYGDCDPETICADFPEIFTGEQMSFGVILDPVPLRNDAIDELCEELNRFAHPELKMVD
jgi:hypothetical protein